MFGAFFQISPQTGRYVPNSGNFTRLVTAQDPETSILTECADNGDNFRDCLAALSFSSTKSNTSTSTPSPFRQFSNASKTSSGYPSASMNLSGEPPGMSMTSRPRLRAASRSSATSGKHRAFLGPAAAGDLRPQLAHPDVPLGLLGADGTDGSCAKRRNSTCLSACPRPDRVRAAASSGPASRPAQARRVAVPRGGASPPSGSGRRPVRSSPGTAPEASPSSCRARARSPDRPAAAVSSSRPEAPRPRSRPRADPA